MNLYLLKAFLKFHRRRAKFTRKQLEELFATISDNKFCTLPLNNFRKIKDSTRVLIGLRFDVDIDCFKSLKLAQIASLYGIYGTFCFLSTAWYAGKIKKDRLHRNNLDWLYRAVYELGNEIGIHNDLLTVQIKHKLNPLEYNYQELEYFAGLNIPIYGTASHGSKLAKELGISNFDIFYDFAKTKLTYPYNGIEYPIGRNTLKEFGYQYESYHLDHTMYISDANGKFRIDGKIVSFDQVICKLKTAEKGTRIQLLIHPEHYRI